MFSLQDYTRNGRSLPLQDVQCSMQSLLASTFGQFDLLLPFLSIFISSKNRSQTMKPTDDASNSPRSAGMRDLASFLKHSVLHLLGLWAVLIILFRLARALFRSYRARSCLNQDFVAFGSKYRRIHGQLCRRCRAYIYTFK